MRIGHGLALVAALALGTTLAGCQSSGVDTAADTAARLDDLAASLDTVSRNIDATSQALDALVAQPNGDLKKLFGAYRDALGDLEKSVAKAGKDARKSTDQKDEFLERWELKLEEIQNQQIRDTSAARRDAAQQAFTEVHAALEEVQALLEPMVQQLRDIRASLSHDLNPNGVKTIAPIAQQVSENAKASKEAIGRVKTELEELSQEITPTTQQS